MAISPNLPKRICIDARFYRKSTAGVGRYTRALISELQKLDQQNKYTVILTPADFAEWPKTGVPSNWTVKILDIVHYSLAEQTQLLHYLNQQKFDLVHFTMFNHPIFYNRPYVVTIHDMIMHLFPLRPLWHPRTWAYRFVMWHAAHKAKHIIVPSQSSRDDVAHMLNVSKSKITITYEGVEDEFKPQTDQIRFAQLKKKYGLTKPFLFFLNAWRPHKGLPELVTAFLTVKKNHDIQLLIGGKPNPSFPAVIKAVENTKARSADILIPGFIPDNDMISLYSMAKAYMFPTHYEGFGIPALEAITCGCPVVAAKDSCTPEVLGDAALYFPAGDANAFAQQINALLSNKKLCDDLRQKGFAQAKKFSLAKMAKETLAVYDNIVK